MRTYKYIQWSKIKKKELFADLYFVAGHPQSCMYIGADIKPDIIIFA